MTQEFLQDAIVDDLKDLFADFKLTNSKGEEKTVNIYAQYLPIRQGADYEIDDPAEAAEQPGDPPEPYVLVNLSEGQLPEPGEAQIVEVILVIGVYDPSTDRQGYRDALHIVNTIMLRYTENVVVGGKYAARFPIKWVPQEGDTHPYYYAGVALSFEVPPIYQEVPET